MQRSTNSTVIVAAVALAAVVTSFTATTFGQGQAPAPAAGAPQKPLVPVAASSVAANPDPYINEYVTLTGAVEANLSKTSFSVDQDKTKSTGKDVTLESSMAKLAASESAVMITNEAVQIHGGYGFIKDFPVEKFYRDVKLVTIGEGTSEIQKLVIARELLG